MQPAIVDIIFPRGALPVRGFKCPKCGEELIQGGTLTKAQEVARRIGLAGVELAEKRTAMKIGSSVGATLPPEMLERLGIKPGSDIAIELLGDHVEIRNARAPTFMTIERMDTRPTDPGSTKGAKRAKKPYATKGARIGRVPGPGAKPATGSRKRVR